MLYAQGRSACLPFSLVAPFSSSRTSLSQSLLNRAEDGRERLHALFGPAVDKRSDVLGAPVRNQLSYSRRTSQVVATLALTDLQADYFDPNHAGPAPPTPSCVYR